MKTKTEINVAIGIFSSPIGTGVFPISEILKYRDSYVNIPTNIIDAAIAGDINLLGPEVRSSQEICKLYHAVKLSLDKHPMTGDSLGMPIFRG